MQAAADNRLGHESKFAMFGLREIARKQWDDQRSSLARRSLWKTSQRAGESHVPCAERYCYVLLRTVTYIVPSHCCVIYNKN